MQLTMQAMYEVNLYCCGFARDPKLNNERLMLAKRIISCRKTEPPKARRQLLSLPSAKALTKIAPTS
jgi:hypothetical protein